MLKLTHGAERGYAHEWAAEHRATGTPSFAKAMEGRHHHAGISHASGSHEQEGDNCQCCEYFPNLHRVIITPYATISISSPSMSVILTATLLPARGSSS